MMLSGIAPVFVSLICCGGLVECFLCEPKSRLGGDRVTIVPAPESSITCGFIEALSLIDIVPVFVPWLAGENVMFMLQLAPGATVPPQAESNAYCVLMAIEETVTAFDPLLVRAMVCCALAVPTS